jgi:hypothetical protein
MEKPEWIDAVMNAISAVDLRTYRAWSDLTALSSNTHVREIQAIPEGIFQRGEQSFTAVATVYVDLNNNEGKDDFSTTDSFPAEVEGHFESRNRAVVDEVSVDTTSFYE